MIRRNKELAYQAYYNKYRPQTFDEVVGQKAIVSTLKNALREGKIAHAYLFCGPRGTGKTTMARLLAKALNCKEGIGRQCNKCDDCTKISKGEHPDVIEIDAASNSTVDSVRALIANVSYQPIMGRYKVYIIDEVHNMSNSAFNALLKTLEEPPSFVVFILATTEPQKIIPTILSRVQRFDFSKVTDTDLIENMEHILKSENISYEEEALKLVASLSDGGVRDSLSLLDQLVSYSGDKVTAEDANNLFGLLSTGEELKLVEAIEKKDSDTLIKSVRERYQKGADIPRLHNDLIAIYKDLLIYTATKDKTLLEKLSEEEAKSFSIPASNLEVSLRCLIDAARDYRTSDNVLSHFELSLMKLLYAPVDTHIVVSSSKPAASSSPVSVAPSEKVLATKPIAVASKKSGEVFKPKDDPKASGKIGYTINDLVNLMNLAVTKENVVFRKNIDTAWEQIKLFFQGDDDFFAVPLYGSKARLYANNILVCTNPVPIELDKLNDKKAEASLMKIALGAFKENIHVLVVSVPDFKEAYDCFRNKKFVEGPVNIDFGESKAKENSTDFFNDLMKK